MLFAGFVAAGRPRLLELSKLVLGWVDDLDEMSVVHGLEHLAFRCTNCGNCCRSLRVVVTHRDLARLAQLTGEPYAALVNWLAPEEVEMSGEPGSFVELAGGRRLMVLAHEQNGCRWLDSERRCRVYSARPMDCRTFPFSLEREAPGARQADGAALRLSLLQLADCEEARDGQERLERIVAMDRERWEALAEYQALVARWNRFARHRQRLRHRARGAAEFFDFLGLNVRATEA